MLKHKKNNSDFIEKIFGNAEEKYFKKGEIISPIGLIHQHFYYVEKGFVRIYFLDSKGNEITQWFSDKGDMAGILSSFVKGQSSIYCMEALEDTVLKVISKEKFEEIRKTTPAVQESLMNMLIEITLHLSDKLIETRVKTAKERYEKLLKEYPTIFQKASLGHIATYLGITQQSLSRIRAN
ncbi:Crp/Fnr family transcriptional regulator [Aureivirga marina]|uniref:Crp/Fnr family transcriptional regulator n=1 Tax=Aureivirga marina TaxID=1182451 RepID=UPI0018C9C59A|nr:Crp/Fnr family transcriptional regulator [Aureivirga marina]